MNKKLWPLLIALFTSSTSKAEELPAIQFEPQVVPKVGAVVINAGGISKTIDYLVLDPEDAFKDRLLFARTSTVEDSTLYSPGTLRLYDIGYDSTRTKVKYDLIIVQNLVDYDIMMQRQAGSNVKIARFIWEHNHTTRYEEECERFKASPKADNEQGRIAFCSELSKIYFALASYKKDDTKGDMRGFLTFEAAWNNPQDAKVIFEYRVINRYGYAQVTLGVIKPEEVENLAVKYDLFVRNFFNQVTKPLTKRNASRYFARKAAKLRKETNGKINIEHHWFNRSN